MPQLVIQPDGSVIVHHHNPKSKLTVEQALARRFGKENVSWVNIPQEAIPKDRTFREAWRHCPKQGVRHCLDTARNIHRDRMRAKRAMLFKEVDAAYMRALMQGKSTDTIALTAQQLRDVPSDPKIDEITDVSELADYWPDVLGEPPERTTPPPVPVMGSGNAHAGSALGSSRKNSEVLGQPQDVDIPQLSGEGGKISPERSENSGGETAPVAPLDMPYQPIGGNEESLAPTQEQETSRVVLDTPVEAPIELPRFLTRGTGNSLRDAMQAVEATEAVMNEPAPDVDPLQKLSEAVRKAYEELTFDSERYELAAKAYNGNHQALAAFEMQAKRAGKTQEDYVYWLITCHQSCQQVWMAVLDVENSTKDAIQESPDDAPDLVAIAIQTIGQKVRDATAYRN